MRKISESITDMIDTNIRLWHEADNIKFKGKPIYNKSSEERVAIFRHIRILNTRRSAIRWEIDSAMGIGSNETKLNYHEDDK